MTIWLQNHELNHILMKHMKLSACMLYLTVLDPNEQHLNYGRENNHNHIINIIYTVKLALPRNLLPLTTFASPVLFKSILDKNSKPDSFSRVTSHAV